MRCSWGLMAVFAVTVAASPGAQERSRETTDEKYKWNLADLYPSDEAWRTEKEKLAASLGEAKAFAGTLGASAAQLARALATQSAQEKTLARLFAYANLLADQDTRVSGPQGMTDEMTQLAAQFGAAWAFVEPELLTLDPKTLEDWIASTPELKPYAFALGDVLRRKAHTLSAREEALLAQTLPMAAGPGNINSIFLNADLPWPTVKQASGKEVRLDAAGFAAARAVADRDDRRKAMEGFFGALGSYRRTLGTTLSTAVQAALFQTRVRSYESTLQRALHGPNIPPSVYTALVDGVNKHLPAFHRYLKLRKRILKVPELHYYDLYAPLVAGVPLEYTDRTGAGPGQKDHGGARRRLRPGPGQGLLGAVDRLLPDARASSRAPTWPATLTTCTRTCCSTTTASTTTCRR